MSARILVVDDQPANVRMLEAKLQAEYFDVCTAHDGPSALSVANCEQPDLILLDVMMPGMDGYETCRRLKADSRTRHIPVVMVTALDQREDRIRGLEAGADDFLTKPVDNITLFARVRSLLRLKAVLDELRYRDQGGALAGIVSDPAELDSGKAAAVIITADPKAGARYADAMPESVSGHCVTDPVGAIDAVNERCDIALIDLSNADFDGLRVCARIRSMPKTRQMPLIAIISSDDIASAVRALDLGVNDILHRPVDPQELAARMRTQLRRARYADKLRNRLDESLELAVTDPLTGLHNRRFLSARLNHAVEGANAGGAPVSVLIVDIDHFKRVNDTLGHDAGDAVLKVFAERLGSDLRALDQAARYGGEEFVVMMPGAGLAEAQIAAERLRRVIGETPFQVDGIGEVPVTVSVGLAQLSPGESIESLLRRADAALYEAKTEGRNRVQAAVSAAA